jgi:drug/metabolite transporter (DMT)-like permease
MGRTEWILLFALAFLWSWVFFLTKVALSGMGPFTVVALRLGIGAALLHVVVLLAGLRMPASPRVWVSFFAIGTLNNFVPFCLIAWGQIRIGSGLAAILNATTPLLTVLLAHVLTRDECMTANRLGGVGLGIAGVAVMIGPGARHGLTTNVAGQVAILGAAMCERAPAYSAVGSADCRQWSQPPGR